MKRILLVALVIVAGTPAWGLAQQASGSRTVIRQAGFGGGVYGGGVEYGSPGCGCGTPVAGPTCAGACCTGYDSGCCRPCFPNLLCAVKRVGRMLDCLLPCNKCCPGTCLMDRGGCRPHLFSRGRVGCSSCGDSTGGLEYMDHMKMDHMKHMPMSDPFIDDPTPARPTPMPEADPSTDVRRKPVSNSPVAVRPAPRTAIATARPAHSPYKIVNSAAPRSTYPTVIRQQPTTRAAVAGRPTLAKPAEQSVLRRASLEQEEAAAVDAEYDAPSQPALLPLTVRKASAELDIPVNPLR